MVIVTNGYEDILLYRHCDGYPEGAGENLKTFFGEAQFGYDTHLDDPEQVSHALIVWHARRGVRVEPACRTHGDIEYIYLVELPKGGRTVKIRGYKVRFKELSGLTAEQAKKRLLKRKPLVSYAVKCHDFTEPSVDVMWAGELKHVAPAYYRELKEMLKE